MKNQILIPLEIFTSTDYNTSIYDLNVLEVETLIFMFYREQEKDISDIILRKIFSYNYKLMNKSIDRINNNFKSIIKDFPKYLERYNLNKLNKVNKGANKIPPYKKMDWKFYEFLLNNSITKIQMKLILFLIERKNKFHKILKIDYKDLITFTYMIKENHLKEDILRSLEFINILNIGHISLENNMFTLNYEKRK
jgi:hypothetical protein